MKNARISATSAEIKVGDRVRLMRIPDSVPVDDFIDSTHQVLLRILKSGRSRIVQKVDASGLVEIMSYRVESDGSRVYDYVLVEPECLMLVSRRE